MTQAVEVDLEAGTRATLPMVPRSCFIRKRMTGLSRRACRKTLPRAALIYLTQEEDEPNAAPKLHSRRVTAERERGEVPGSSPVRVSMATPASISVSGQFRALMAPHRARESVIVSMATALADFIECLAIRRA